MGKKKEKADVEIKPTDSVIHLPVMAIGEGALPGHPRNVELSLSPARRTRLWEILRGLQATGAKVLVGRGGEPVHVPVSKFADVLYWLLDNVQPEGAERKSN